MTLELPTDLINILKKVTRAEAGLSDDVFASNYNHLPPLPSLSEVVAAFDPSPPYLRCKNCHGRLLRGVESMFCIYCGRATDFDHPPISFKDSIAYRWLLESLDLDGSELVTPHMERNPSKQEIPLSDLLDLKIQWPAEADKKDYSSSNKDHDKRISMNFTGVDLDNFFSKSTFDDPSNTQEESSITRKNMEATDFQVDVPHHNVSLFENVQPSESTIPKSFSGWEADFQISGAIDEAVSLDHSGYHQDHDLMDSSLLEQSFLDRVVDSGNESGNRDNQQPILAEREAKTERNGKNKEVGMLISKMHDLSFIVEDKLSKAKDPRPSI